MTKRWFKTYPQGHKRHNIAKPPPIWDSSRVFLVSVPDGPIELKNMDVVQLEINMNMISKRGDPQKESIKPCKGGPHFTRKPLAFIFFSLSWKRCFDYLILLLLVADSYKLKKTTWNKNGSTPCHQHELPWKLNPQESRFRSKWFSVNNWVMFQLPTEKLNPDDTL